MLGRIVKYFETRKAVYQEINKVLDEIIKDDERIHNSCFMAYSEDGMEALFFTLGLNGSQGTLFIGLQLPAVFNEDGHPIIELKKHNVASFDTELDTRRMSLPNFIYFLEEVNKIEIVGDNMIFKDAPSANHKDRFDYCLENAVTDC